MEFSSHRNLLHQTFWQLTATFDSGSSHLITYFSKYRGTPYMGCRLCQNSGFLHDIQWNLSKPNPLGTHKNVWFREVFGLQRYW